MRQTAFLFRMKNLNREKLDFIRICDIVSVIQLTAEDFLMRLFFLLALTAAVFLTGCLGAPYRETVYYDIVPPETGPAGKTFFQVTDLRNLSGAGNRFQYRDASGRIDSDPDLKWLMQPGALVARAMRLALSDPAGGVQTADPAQMTYVRGDLLVFETDMEKKAFCLHARFRVTPPGGKEQALDCNIRIPMQNVKPESVTRAATLAVGELVKQLKKVR